MALLPAHPDSKSDIAIINITKKDDMAFFCETMNIMGTSYLLLFGVIINFFVNFCN